MVKLLIQPQDGIAALLSAIKKAKTTIEVVIFRFDRAEIEQALMAAVRRGVAVSALIAYANRGGEKQLRKLEMRLLDAGVKVSRTPAKLVRYHNKMMVVDGTLLFVLSFNFTHMDIDHSRAFGIVTRKPKLVQEAMKLFAADSQRKTYKAGLDTFIVSPVNARRQLAAFINKAKKELLIYDPSISDTNMAKALVARATAGVKIRVIGAMSRKNAHIEIRRLTGLRLHTRTIIRDRREAFVGSQSLRQPELDQRREIGILVREPKVVNALLATFEKDWESSGFDEARDAGKADAEPKSTAKATRALVKEMAPLKSTLKKAIKQAVAKAGKEAAVNGELKSTVKHAVKAAVKEAVKEMNQEAR